MKGNRIQPQCGFSAKTVAALDMVLPDYLTVDVLQNPEIREGIKAYGNWPTVPQLYVAGELIGGCDIVTEMFDFGRTRLCPRAGRASGPGAADRDRRRPPPTSCATRWRAARARPCT